jgi:hypothetical protein
MAVISQKEYKDLLRFRIEKYFKFNDIRCHFKI